MSSPLQSLNHSDSGMVATGQTKRPNEAKPLQVKNLSARKNSAMICFGPSLKVASTRNSMMYNKRAVDPAHPDIPGVLMKNKNLLAELRNLQSKIFIKESSLKEMKTELESYKENNVQQSLQIISLRDDVKDLQELIASLMRIKCLKNTNIQSLERGNCNLTERVTELEKRLRVHLVEREKAERKADLLEKKLFTYKFPPYMNMEGQEDSLDIVPVKDMGEATVATTVESNNNFYSDGLNDVQKIWDTCAQDLLHEEKQSCELDRPPHSWTWATKTVQSQHQNFLDQLSTLLSDSIGPIPATEEAVKERIQEIGASEQSWKSRTEDLQREIQMLSKRVEQLQHLYEQSAEQSPAMEENDKDNKRPLQYQEGNMPGNDFSQGNLDLDGKKENPKTQNSQINEHKKFKELEMLLDIRQNLQTDTVPRMEEKIQKLQKQLSDLKLSNKNMKTQLTRVNVLKDKTIEKLRQSLTKVEMTKEKPAMKADNLKMTLGSAEQELKSDLESAPQMLQGEAPKLSTAKSTPEEVSGQEQELIDFRETIMKMLGLNMKTADKEVINQLKLIVQVYEISKKPKISSDCKTSQNNQ
ncbi:coiled-coil domain-containing protein 170-like [Perognathus longimembris pacificus]|uniref:coiled-coil domain-containing protein 170-like n=1 Tax=Perognathus longimembris pacificus TaxID=214514 RepID=UPI002019B891|nr:coiled-coil domain-containing protein 170-like [Perognathus longimembris pacificus]